MRTRVYSVATFVAARLDPLSVTPTGEERGRKRFVRRLTIGKATAQ
jgi:hypothetical protein